MQNRLSKYILVLKKVCVVQLKISNKNNKFLQADTSTSTEFFFNPNMSNECEYIRCVKKQTTSCIIYVLKN